MNIWSRLSEIGPSQPLSDGEVRALVAATARSAAQLERDDLEFKVTLDETPGSQLALIKHLVAVANFGGGRILLGLGDDGRRIGLSKSLLSELDPARITDKIRKYAGSGRVTTSYTECSSYGKRYGLLSIEGATEILVFDKDGNRQDKSGKTEAVFHAGVIYCRDSGSTRPATGALLRSIEQRIVEDRTSKLLAKIQTVASAPDADLIVANRGTSEGIMVVDSGSGVPVRIDRSGSGEAVPIREVVSQSVPFSSPQNEIASQVRLWKNGRDSHTVDKRTTNDWYLKRAELQLDDDALEFCLRSTLMRRGFPMYWASQLSEERLLEVINDVLGSNAYPAREITPLLTAAFFWNQRFAILDPFKATLGPAYAQRLQKLQAGDRWRFLTRHVLNSDGPVVGGSRHLAPWVAKKSLSQTEDEFDALVASDTSASPMNEKLRPLARQIDVYLHAPDTPKLAARHGIKDRRRR